MSLDFHTSTTESFQALTLNDQASTSSLSRQGRNRRQKRRNKKQHENINVYLGEDHIYIIPIPKTVSTSEFIEFFSEFKLYGVHSTKIWMRIQFKESNSVEYFASKTDWIPTIHFIIKREPFYAKADTRPNQELTAKKVTTKQNNKNIPNNSSDPCRKDEKIKYENIAENVESKNTFIEQLTIFLSEIQLPDADANKRYNGVCPRLNYIFKTIFPDCKIHKFGSTVAGLGFKESDLDIYVDVGSTGMPSSLLGPNEVQSDRTSYIFKKVKRIMYAKRHIFDNIIPIPKAKTPIIRFVYQPTQILCDITFKNSLGIYKTTFLKYCALYDARSKPLLLLVKYWAMHMGLTGTKKISNYGVAMLVIFYLQQTDILPSLVQLRQNCEPKYVEGWQVNFNKRTLLPPTSDNSSIPELFHNFLMFYATFNFDNCILSLLDGKTYTVDQMRNMETLPEYMDTYKHRCNMQDINSEEREKKLDYNKPMCVQDPIELNQNTFSVTPQQFMNAFQHYCWYSAQICNTVSGNNYNDLFKILFGTLSPSKADLELEESFSYMWYILTPYDKIFSFEMLQNDTHSELYKNTNDYIACQWNNTAIALIKDIFENVLKLEVEMHFCDGIKKHHKFEIISFGPADTNVEIILLCSTTYNVWRDRKKMKIKKTKYMNYQNSVFQKEIIKSNKMMNEKTKRKIRFSLSCTMREAGKILFTPKCHVYDISDIADCMGYFQKIINQIMEDTLSHMIQHNITYSQYRQDICFDTCDDSSSKA